MAVATALELAIFWTMLASRDHRTVIVGMLLATGYARYSASRAACERFIEWWHDNNSPPPGGA
jgi:hypothetical protein